MSIITQKPNVRNSWATTGNLGSPTIDRILEGWVEEIPPSNIFNWLDNRQDTAIKYIFQEGFAEWDENFEYNLNSLTKYEGKVYLSKSLNTGKQPDIFPDVWGIAFDEYGASALVQETVEKILNQEGFLSLYVSKANPVMDAPANAPSFKAESGQPSTTQGQNPFGFSFENDDHTGFYKIGTSPNERLAFYEKGILKGLIPVGNETTSSYDATLVTTKFLKDYVDQKLQASLIQVGMSIITQDPRDPFEYLKYGTWELDCQGRAIVGFSRSTSPDVPEWTKNVNATGGAYKVNVNFPNDGWEKDGSQIQTSVSGRLVVGSGQTEIKEILESLTQASEMQTQVLDLAQPSQTKYVYTRVG